MCVRANPVSERTQGLTRQSPAMRGSVVVRQ